MTFFQPEQRHIPLPGTHNLRDTGGYTTIDGRRTRWGVLLRSDSVHTLPEDSRKALIEYGLRTIIDLRSPQEISRWPSRFAVDEGVKYYNLPLLNPEATASPPTLAELYRSYFDERQDDLRQIFEALTAPGATPVLVHCFIGKDRTGMTIALALSAVGVPDETVADDYSLSYNFLTQLYVEIRAGMLAEGVVTESFDRYVDSHRETMLETLTYLREHYGGAEAYLRTIGLSDAAIERLKVMLVE